jgi:hypothetical protein
MVKVVVLSPPGNGLLCRCIARNGGNVGSAVVQVRAVPSQGIVRYRLVGGAGVIDGVNHKTGGIKVYPVIVLVIVAKRVDMNSRRYIWCVFVDLASIKIAFEG